MKKANLQNSLDVVARTVDAARRACAGAVAYLRRAQAAAVFDARPPTPEEGGDRYAIRERLPESAVNRPALTAAEEAHALAQAGYEAANQAYQLLVVTMGANRPGKPIPRDTVPLALLDTPATRELLDALRRVEVAAHAVDRERGWIDDDGNGIGFAETFAAHRLGVEREVCGAPGKGLE